LKVRGAELGNIFTLRSLADADAILSVANEGARAVVVGASFIGMEVAFSLASGPGADVTVIDMETTPFARTLGPEVGAMYQALHEENGVSFRLGAGVKAFGGDGDVSGVVLDSGETLAADLVVLGVGVSPSTHFVSGIDRDIKDGSVLVNAQLQSSDPDIFAAGDIARWNGVRVEHWRSAQQQGMVAARNMLGGKESISDHVPFFWTGQWKHTLRYVGHTIEWDEIIYRGDPADRNFVAFYVLDGAMVAAAGMKHDPDMVALEYILRDGIPLSVDEMSDPDYDLIAHALEN
jgi:NADPH-dependent 2,4-dienoyl-CoA reductase/sulfur reductase-like enzyme